jgi:glycosyltransferase involved in cell wall biosynthesis
MSEAKRNGITLNGDGAGCEPAPDRPEILFVTSYPPRECGIATYSYDLMRALDNKFGDSFSIKVCALESGAKNHHAYPDEVEYVLDTTDPPRYARLARLINSNDRVKVVVIQHEFGFFQNVSEGDFLQFLRAITKPIVINFHTMLPRPDESLKARVQRVAAACEAIIVMTHSSARILMDDYEVPKEKVAVIAHGTHLVLHLNKDLLKEKYGLKGKKVLSTFGLLGPGKSIETTLEALPAIIKTYPDVMFLVLGKTHPEVLRSEGEKYRDMLKAKVGELELQQNVRFINRYLPLQDLLEYLQLTDIYLFTSKDPSQAVSGTFAYAMSCACPIISTPIPHAREVLRGDTGIIIDFQNPEQVTKSIMRLLSDEPLLEAFTSNAVQRISPTAWENIAIAHALLLERISGGEVSPRYRLPEVNLAHVKKMTTDFGIVQFSKFNQPDIGSGYTLDDNARALIALCKQYELTGDEGDLSYVRTYLDFLKHCQQPEGDFLNYVDSDKRFTGQNSGIDLADANGRAIWALGYLLSNHSLLPAELTSTAEAIMQRALPRAAMIHATRAMAFAIKGLFYYNSKAESPQISSLIKTLANRLVEMYRHESEEGWQWFESYLTYANSVLPEAMLCAWQETGEQAYKDVAKASFDFLLSRTFNAQGIKVISNRGWLHKGEDPDRFGEQPIDVAYTVMALSRFYSAFKDEDYLRKMETAFDWFLGNNHLHQIIYNPCTGGCYDGLEENDVNLNQGAESTVSYLMARLTIEKHLSTQDTLIMPPDGILSPMVVPQALMGAREPYLLGVPESPVALKADPSGDAWVTDVRPRPSRASPGSPAVR